MLTVLVASAIYLWHAGPFDIYVKLYLWMMPLLVTVGVAEDLLSGVSAAKRLVASIILVGVLSVRLVVSGELTAAWISSDLTVPVVFVTLCLIGIVLIHGTNLIDGLNGLASIWGLLALLSLLWIGQSSGLIRGYDGVSIASTMLIAALVLFGFLLVNFPWGLIFLGDAGAYLIGISVFTLATFLIIGAQDISTVCRVLVVISYPAMELAWTIVRRIHTPGVRVGEPDNRHLHSHVHNIVRRHCAGLHAKAQNSLSTVILVGIFIQIPTWLALLMPTNIAMNIACMVALPCYYVGLHHLTGRLLVQNPDNRDG